MGKVAQNRKSKVELVKDVQTELVETLKEDAVHIMDDGKVDVEDAKRVAKHIFTSKTFIVNVIAIAAIFVQTKWGYIIDESLQMQILGAINIGLRMITNEPVRW